MGACFSPVNKGETKLENGQQATGSTEEKFTSVRKNQQINTKDDLTIKKGDFVFEHSGRKLTDIYSVDSKILGEGAFGVVQRCQHKITKEIRAVKILRRSAMDEKDLIRLEYEIDILKNLDHPNIVKLYEIFKDKDNVYLVTELCTGGELFDEITSRQQFSEQDAAEIIKQVFEAVAYCHGQKVCHRDLKPENILLESKKNNNIIKIIDFGTSQVYGSDKMHQTYGTPYYIAPEVLKGSYDYKCDIWSIGVILFILLCGRPPFGGQDDQDILRKVKEGSFSYNDTIWKKRSAESMDLINKCLTKDPSKRITALQALQHPWIKAKAQSKGNEVLTKEAFSNLKSFRSEQKLQQAAITFIVCNLSTKKEQEELQKTFKELDLNGDGKLSKEELFEGYKKIYPTYSEEELRTEVDKFFQSADMDGNGDIDYSEWQVATINKKSILQDEKLKAAFELFDKDGSGTINADEIKQILGVGKKFGNEKIWQEIVKEVDQDNNGEISFDEFKVMMHKFLGEEVNSKAGKSNPKNKKNN